MGKTKNVRRNKSRGKGRKRNMKGGMPSELFKALLVAMATVTDPVVEKGVKLITRTEFAQLVKSKNLGLQAISNLNVIGHFTEDPNYCDLVSTTCASVASAPVVVVDPKVWKPINEANQSGNDYLIYSVEGQNPINLYTRGITPDWEDNSGYGYFFLNDVPDNEVAPESSVIFDGVVSTLSRELPKVLVSDKFKQTNDDSASNGGSRKKRPKTKRRSKRY